MTANLIKELRSRTGCGVVDCKEALAEANDDMDKAIEILRKKGKSKAAKKADRDTAEGIVANYVHSNNKLAVMVTLLCETDFVARNERFQELGKDIAMHIAASDPSVVSPDDVAEEALEKEKAVAMEAAKGKPEDIQKKIVDGKLETFKEQQALLTQPFVKDPSKNVQALIEEAVHELGENISVGSFTRLSI